MHIQQNETQLAIELNDRHIKLRPNILRVVGINNTRYALLLLALYHPATQITCSVNALNVSLVAQRILHKVGRVKLNTSEKKPIYKLKSRS